jgi:hypothetical protein
MSGLETLPPDQRAVLQLILRQGRGYADLAGLLKIDVRAVRERAHAGLAALGGPAPGALDPAHRARVADYVLGQQDEAERIVTLASLGEAPEAAEWARRLRAQLAPLASAPLPEVPQTVNGNAPAAQNGTAAAPGRPRPSRLGGAILLGGVGAALVAVLLVVLLSGGGSGKGDTATGTNAAARTQAQTSPQAPSQATAQPVAQVNFTSPSGGPAIGLGIVERSGSTLILAAQAERLAANGPQDGYALWLQGPPGPKLLGFVPQRVGSNGTFAVSASLPANAKRYTSIVVTREPTTSRPVQPGTVVLNGRLTLS